MTTTESSGTVVILDVLTRGSPALRGALTDRWRVVESIPAAGSERCGLVGVSDGADAALRHALQDPENVEVLVLVSPTAIRPANAAGDANDDAAEVEARLAHVQWATLVVSARRIGRYNARPRASTANASPTATSPSSMPPATTSWPTGPRRWSTWYPTTSSAAKPSSSRTAARSSTPDPHPAS